MKRKVWLCTKNGEMSSWVRFIIEPSYFVDFWIGRDKFRNAWHDGFPLASIQDVKAICIHDIFGFILSFGYNLILNRIQFTLFEKYV